VVQPSYKLEEVKKEPDRYFNWKEKDEFKGSFTPVSIVQNNNIQESEIVEITEKNNDFSEELLQEKCRNYASLLKEQGRHLTATMLNDVQFSLKENFEVEVVVSSEHIVKNFEDEKALLLQFLEKELHNNKINFSIKVNEAIAKKVIFSSKERFEEMAKKNPNLLKLREKLNMSIDF